MLDYCFDCSCPYIWVWKILITWGRGEFEISFYPDYETPIWTIEFNKWEKK